jgi:hypothetical protein
VNRHPASSSSSARLRASWVAPLARGVSGDSEQVDSRCLVLDDERDVQAAERDRAVYVEEIGASNVAAWARRNTHYDPSRPDGGGIRRTRRILRIVESATLWPSRRISPWILTTPHRVFSQARRTISVTSS